MKEKHISLSTIDRLRHVEQLNKSLAFWRDSRLQRFVSRVGVLLLFNILLKAQEQFHYVRI